MKEQELVAKIKATKAPVGNQKITIKTTGGNLIISKEEINSTIGAYIAMFRGGRIGRYSYGQSNSRYPNAAKAWEGLKSDLIKQADFLL